MEHDKAPAIERLKAQVRLYFDACNRADRELFHEGLSHDCEHYFPPGVGGVYRSADATADLWNGFVRRMGSHWRIDRIIVKDDIVAVKWRHWKQSAVEHIRGYDWYTFSEDGTFNRTRSHYASPRDASRKKNELAGFDYLAHGYPSDCPDLEPSIGRIRQEHLELEVQR